MNTLLVMQRIIQAITLYDILSNSVKMLKVTNLSKNSDVYFSSIYDSKMFYKFQVNLSITIIFIFNL